MGTPDFAVGTLKELIDNQYDVVAVVTQPDKPKGRSKELVFSPVKEEAVKNNIQVLQPERARDEAFVEELLHLDSYCLRVLLICHVLDVLMYTLHCFLSTGEPLQSSGQ